MRILVYNWRDLAHPNAGGAEVFTHEVLRRWARRGHDVTLFAAAVPGRPSYEQVDHVNVVRRGTRWGVYAAARRFFAEHDADHFDVVVDEINTRPFKCPRFVGDTPVLALAHQVAREVWFSEMPWPAAALGCHVLEPHWLRKYRYVPTVTISESSRCSLEEYGLQRVTVITPPQPDPPLRGADDASTTAKETAPTLLFVGRLAANKRPDHAVEVLREVRRELPDAQLWVVGDGELARRLRRRNDPGVVMFGHVDNDTKHQLMARAHLLVVTSVREGWGMVVDEAAAVGTPSVAYDVAGLRDSVARAGGVLVEPSPAAMAHAVRSLLPRLVAGDDALIPVTINRSWDDVAGELLDALDRLCRSDRPTGQIARTVS